MKHSLVITVDGPAGAGKSSVSKLLAEEISCLYLDTGALYRAVAWRARQKDVMPDDREGLSRLCGDIVIEVTPVGSTVKIVVDGDDVTDKIRTEEIGLLASKISAVPVVRKRLLPVQQEIGRGGGIVAEGRDMGTVVFPHADIKFYLIADVAERARRRYRELIEKGEHVEFTEIQRSMAARDRRDSARSVAPLMAADDAVIIDSTSLDIAGVVSVMKGIVGKHSDNGV
jgi:cytidylate kinase